MAIICEQQNSPDFSRFFCVRLSVRPSGFLEVLRRTKWRERWLCTRNLTRLDYIGIYIGACVSFIKSKESDRVAHESWAETNRHRVECCIHQTYSSISSGNLFWSKVHAVKVSSHLVSLLHSSPIRENSTQSKLKKEKRNEFLNIRALKIDGFDYVLPGWGLHCWKIQQGFSRFSLLFYRPKHIDPFWYSPLFPFKF